MIANVFRAFLSQKLEAGGSETTIYLDRITTLTGESITTSDFADFSRGIITVNPDGDGISSFPEYISFTGVSGLTLTGAARGLSAKSNSVIAANKRFHPADTPVILSFGGHNIQDLLDYIDAQIAALTLGANVVSTGTAGEDLTAGQLVYLKNDGKWWKTDADTAATLFGVILGIAQSTTTANNTITSGVLQKGLDTNQSGLTAGNPYYASNTAGAISASAGTNTKKIGVARSTTNLYFDPYFESLPTADEKAAMAGAGATPSASNKFLTVGDVDDNTLLPPPQVVTFTASGTWTKDPGLKYIVVEAVGGGGGGRYDASSAGGGGGGGGGYVRKVIPAASLGATETVTIGAGGAGGTSGSQNGVNGAATTMGSLFSAGGGTGATSGTGGAGGSATGGDLNINGQAGTNNITDGNQGSSSFFGGLGGASYLSLPALAAQHRAAVGYGFGGYGGSADDGADGGAGASGIVIVTEYYS